MDLDRPQLYFFLLPFTIISLIIYIQILIEISRKKAFDSFFFRMICSQSIYDISYVIMYFIMEIPQDWPSMWPFLLAMNDSIIPQLVYAHIFMCLVAQIIGVTVMAFSRMLLICHPSHRVTKVLTNLSMKRVFMLHMVIPAIYACYITFGQVWRYYGFLGEMTRISRLGDEVSIAVNSRVVCLFSFIGFLFSAACYIRIIITLQKRPIRFWKNEISILATSFVLFCALCAIAAYFLCNLFIIDNKELYFNLRKHFYAFTFFLSLANPWCLLFSSVDVFRDGIDIDDKMVLLIETIAPNMGIEIVYYLVIILLNHHVLENRSSLIGMTLLDLVLMFYAAYTVLIFVVYIFEVIAIVQYRRDLFKTSFYKIFSVLAIVNMASCLIGSFVFRLGLYPKFRGMYSAMGMDNGFITAAHSCAYYLNCLSEFLGVLLAFNRFTALYTPLLHDQAPSFTLMMFWQKFIFAGLALCITVPVAPIWFLFDDPTKFIGLGDNSSMYYVVVASSSVPEPSIWFNMVIVTLVSNGVASLLYIACIGRLCFASKRNNLIAERNLFLVGFCSMLFSLPYMTAMLIFYRNLSVEIGSPFDIELMRFITYQIPWLTDLKYLTPAPMLFITNKSIRRTIRKTFSR